MANKKQAGGLVVVLVASAAIIGAVALIARRQASANSWNERLPPSTFYAGLRGTVNPYTGAYMSAQQVTEMEWL